jgi:CheY-like chemotaxis protein
MKTSKSESGRKMNSVLQATDKAVVLVIDDDPEAIAGLAKVLSAAGYISQCCHDAEGAIDCVRQTTPDLIIADINISGHSGIQLCERIKRDEGLADVPAMFLSRTQVPDIIRRSREAGGTYFLRKPFDAQVLLELVDKALWMPRLVAGHAG